MKIVYFLLIIVLVISFTSAIRIGMSPDKIKINTSINKEICKNITLYGEQEFFFETYVLWSKKESKNPEEYKINSEQLGIITKHNEQRGLKAEEICFTATKSGKYYGMVFNKVIGQNIGAAMPVYLEVQRDPSEIYDIISANTIKDLENSSLEINLLLILLLLFLTIILIKLIYKRSFSHIPIE